MKRRSWPIWHAASDWSIRASVNTSKIEQPPQMVSKSYHILSTLEYYLTLAPSLHLLAQITK